MSEAPVPGGKTVLVSIENKIAWVSLNRPEKRNAISPELCNEMLAVLDALEPDPRVGVLVLTGAGNAYSGGMDLREFFRASDPMTVEERAVFTRSSAAWQWRRLGNYLKPTICMVNGWCFGGACRSMSLRTLSRSIFCSSVKLKSIAAHSPGQGANLYDRHRASNDAKPRCRWYRPRTPIPRRREPRCPKRRCREARPFSCRSRTRSRG